MKFKIGDKVKIRNGIKEYLKNNYFLGLPPYMELYENRVAEVKDITEDNSYKLDIDGEEYNWLDYMFEPYKVEMKKEDLKIGDLCTCRNGKKAIYIGDFLLYVLGGSGMNMYSYDGKLNHKTDDGYDIIKVEKPFNYKTVYQNNEILDSTEKKYLAAVIKPFRNSVSFISKKEIDNKEYIAIFINDEDYTFLPYFDKGTMYIGMKKGKKYTLKDLGI